MVENLNVAKKLVLLHSSSVTKKENDMSKSPLPHSHSHSGVTYSLCAETAGASLFPRSPLRGFDGDGFSQS